MQVKVMNPVQSPSIGAPMAEVQILCPNCRKPNSRTTENFRRARFCQHCGQDVVLNNDGPRYYITRVIKEGGQGAVYEAIDDTMRIYAVKEMLDRFIDPKERDEAISRFEAEAKMLQAFRHPRVPRIYADFKDEGRHYLVMDFVRGEDLEDIIKREKSIPEAQVLTWAGQISDVLQHLHEQDPPVIFRDMKPSNIMIERDGGVKLIDFGIAKVFQPTQRGTQIGTPGYAPPEQYQGIATPESDVYALGATLHHLLTGRDPRDHMPFTFPPVRDLNPAISERTSAAIDKAVQKFAADRFPTIAAFQAALRPQPAPPIQVRVAPSTQALPAAAQVGSPSQPVQGRVPIQPPVASQPPVATRPSQPAQPANLPANAGRAPSQAPAAQPATKPKPAPKPRRSFPFGGFIITLLAIVLIAATLVFAFPDVVAPYIPQLNLATPTVVTYRQISFTSTEAEIIVPAGGDVYELYRQEFIRQVQEQYPGAQINPNAPLSFVGGAEKIGDEAGGTRYRAQMQGFISIPQ